MTVTAGLSIPRASFLQWNKIGMQQRHGINVPLFSLRTEKNLGIGEFFDLIPLIDWCYEVGFQVIQLLPLNDSGNDPSPYNALSSCALNPIYLSLSKLPLLQHPLALPEAPHLNDLPRVAYLEVLSLKLHFLHQYYDQVGKKLQETREFQEFIKKNNWITPYALFKTLKDELQHIPWINWPEELKVPDLHSIIEERYEKGISFYLLLQYLAHLQLSSIQEHAHSKGILLKGDIPILVSLDSADAWSKPHLFNFSLSAGVPPDMYNPQGQYWGFPLFNWECFKSDHFTWWKERLLVAAQYYDLYRIDHVVGFFRIWAIPLHQAPAEGRFLPDNPAIFLPQGQSILQMMLDVCGMLPIAEDLGTVPSSVKEVLMKMGICGTRVIRWEKNYDQQGKFIPYEEYPTFSMTTVSTHDSETLQLWWQNSSEEAKQFCLFKGWDYSPDLSFDYRRAILRDSHHTPSLFHINLLQEYLALFPEFTFLDPQEERINIPGTILPQNWTYRLKVSLEKITSHSSLKKLIEELLK